MMPIQSCWVKLISEDKCVITKFNEIEAILLFIVVQQKNMKITQDVITQDLHLIQSN